jgi:hypothetical protein
MKGNEMRSHTAGPWFADSRGSIWRRPPSELYENGGGVAGDEPLATAYVGWSHKDAQAYPLKENARLIAAAPDLLEALQKFVAWSNAEANHEGTTFWERVEMLRELDSAAAAAIAKATGGEK